MFAIIFCVILVSFLLYLFLDIEKALDFLIAASAIAYIIGVALAIYVAQHFIVKYW